MKPKKSETNPKNKKIISQNKKISRFSDTFVTKSQSDKSYIVYKVVDYFVFQNQNK